MLRRNPTSIQLTPEDISIYEDRLAREQQAKIEKQRQLRQNAATQVSQGQNRDPNEEPRAQMQDGDREAQRKREARRRGERLGLGTGNGSGSGGRN